MFPDFLIKKLKLLGSTQFFTPYRGFPLIIVLLGMLYCLSFKAWKTIDFLTCVPIFLFSANYLSLLFNFKTGPSLGLSCLMSSIFIIILIIRIINTTCFINTTLMAELPKENFVKVGGLFLPRTSQILVTFTRFLACTLRKISSTSTLKHFYRRCCIFGFITHLLMDK